jgi:7-cyano-7-deazaguanine reductase
MINSNFIYYIYKDKIPMVENKSYVTNYKIEDPESVKTDILEPIEYAYRSKRSIDITIKQPEYTSVCPMTGLPDNGCITIKYRPDKTLVELKSLKYYLLQFRNVGMFYEHVVNKILDDLVMVLNPLRMEVTGEFTPRGGVSSIATAVHEKQE